MDSTTILIVLALLAAVGGLAAGFMMAKRRDTAASGRTGAEAQNLLEEAQKEAEILKFSSLSARGKVKFKGRR